MSDAEQTKQDADLSAVDAVFVIGTGSKNDNEELKYALRNLDRHCPFIRNVYISGECPDWVDTTVVRHLPWPDRFKHAKDANIIDKLRHACEQPGIAKRVLFCSDDQFVTRTCTWEDFAPRWLRQYDPQDGWYEARNRLWHSRLHKTLDRDRRRRKSLGLNQANVYYYQPHMWMQMDRDRFIEYAKWSDYEHRDDTIIASGYFNFVDAGGKRNFDHVFISPGQKWPVTATHVAYSDTAYVDAMRFLRGEFPEESKFEKSLVLDVRGTIRQRTDERPSVDEESLVRFKETVKSEPAWHSMQRSVDMAEDMRTSNFPGWEKVWEDLILRWKLTTEDGKLIVPVTRLPDGDVLSVVEKFRKSRGMPVKTPPVETATTSKGCPTCEARRRREQEAKKEAEKPREPEPQPSVPKEAKEAPEACEECAVDHLAMAVAYLNSNAVRPDSLDIALARGEVKVAAQHLLALNYMDEYTRCTQALDSFRSESSAFTAETFKTILKQLTTRHA